MTTGSGPSARTTVNSRQRRPLRQMVQRRPTRSIAASSSGSNGFTVLKIEDCHTGPVTVWVMTQEHPPIEAPAPQHVAATAFIDAGHPDIRAFAERAVAGTTTDRERISRLFTAVRDGIRYDPYQLSYDPQDYVASNIISRGAAFCIPKAVVLTAAARSLGIPARLGFSDVKNHLQSPKLAQRMRTDVFVFHGYSEMYVQGAWRKATPAFNAELCERFGVAPLSFDGSADALLHPLPRTGAPTWNTSGTAGSTPIYPSA